MNSYENLSSKELENIEKNLIKQVERVRNERKLRAKDNDVKSSSTLGSMFKISLFSNKEEPKKKVTKEPKEKVVKEKVTKEPKEKVVKEKVTKEKVVTEKSSSETRAIKATVSSMKEVLDYHHIDYPSNAKKDDLSKLLRENNLVREAEKKESNKKADK